MSNGHQPKHQGTERPTPPTNGSGVIPPSGHVDPARVLAIYEDHITRLQEEAGSWRRAAEKAEAEKAVLSARVDTLTIAMRNGRHAFMGGTAVNGTPELLRWAAERSKPLPTDRDYPSREIFFEFAAMVETADRMMRATLYPED